MTRRLLILILLAHFLTICSARAFQAADLHSIAGTVIEADGSPSSTASVAAILATGGGAVGGVGWTRTDSEGRFHLRLPSGDYVIRAKAPASGYPDPGFLLCHDPTASFPEVSVGQADVSDVITLGTKEVYCKVSSKIQRRIRA